jgi:hypothetical protein
MGLICSDHFQPGSQVILTMDISPNLTISILAFGGVRISSGVLKLFFWDVDLVVVIVLLLLYSRDASHPHSSMQFAVAQLPGHCEEQASVRCDDLDVACNASRYHLIPVLHARQAR